MPRTALITAAALVACVVPGPLPAEQGTVLAAINGDFFQMGGEPYRGTVQGTTIIDGELVTGPGGGHAFCLDRDGRPAILAVAARFELSWPDGAKTPFRVNAATSDFRSAVGAADVVLFTPRFGGSTQTKAGRELLLTPAPGSPTLPLRAGRAYTLEVGEVRAAADTPIPADGLGLSHREMAERLLELGCTDGLNLDGGGSATMLVAGQAKVPRDGRQQRPVGNALFVVRRPQP